MRILVTGVGGPAAVSFMRAVDHLEHEIFAGDMDPYAPGLFLVPEGRRLILRPGTHDDFVDHLLQYCADNRIDVLVPTVDCELLPIATRRSSFVSCATQLLLADATTLAVTLDKHSLHTLCCGVIPVPRSRLLDASFQLDRFTCPALVKPRTGSGSRGIRYVECEDDLTGIPRDGSMLIQEFLPGTEYSVDVFCSRSGRVVAAVPRVRLRIDSGVAIVGRTVHDRNLEFLASLVATRIGLNGVANIQFREDELGIPRLLEVNPRFPGTMPLTVAAGVNMPSIAMQELCGINPEDYYEFSEVGVVRTFRETFVPVDEFDQTVSLSDIPCPLDELDVAAQRIAS